MPDFLNTLLWAELKKLVCPLVARRWKVRAYARSAGEIADLRLALE